VVAWSGGGNTGADRLDDPGTLVSEDHRRWQGTCPVEAAQIAVAHARRDQADRDLSGARRLKLEIFDDEPGAARVHHGRFHVTPHTR